MREVRVEILVEEPSMEHFLRGLLPKLLPDGYLLDHNCFIRPHEGKSDLRKSIPRKAKTYPYWPTPVKLIIIHDQDSNDCRNLKSELEKLVRDVNGASLLLIRIACRELENWYLGDFDAVEKVAHEHKLQIVFDKSGELVMIYTDPVHDYTDFVLEELGLGDPNDVINN